MKKHKRLSHDDSLARDLALRGSPKPARRGLNFLPTCYARMTRRAEADSLCLCLLWNQSIERDVR